MMLLVETLATIVSVSAAINLAFGRKQHLRISMLLWALSSSLWFVFAYDKGLSGLMITSSTYFAIELIAFFRYSKEKH